MVNFETRRGDGVTYQRGSGSVETELEKVQSCLETLDPRVRDIEVDVRQLRSDRDSAMGMLKVIATLQVLIIGILIALFTWGLNHMEFHSSYEQRSENAPQSAAQ